MEAIVIAAAVTGIFTLGSGLLAGIFLIATRRRNGREGDSSNFSTDPGTLPSGGAPIEFWEKTIRQIIRSEVDRLAPALELIATKIDTVGTKAEGAKVATESVGTKIDVLISEVKKKNGGF